MSAAATPGPWVVEDGPDGIWIYGQQRDGLPPVRYVAEIVTLSDGEGRDEALANARLLATAPALLHALKLTVGDNGHVSWCRGRFKTIADFNAGTSVRVTEDCAADCPIILAAIAKAEGKAP